LSGASESTTRVSLPDRRLDQVPKGCQLWVSVVGDEIVIQLDAKLGPGRQV
jgi:hypothetical protein